MAQVYVDSSVILAFLLREPGSEFSPDPSDSLLTSELTELECRRTLDRIRIQEHLDNEEVSELFFELDLILKAMRVIQLGSAVLTRAKASFPTVVRSLDAIHLATAELTSASVFFSKDHQQLTAARAIGFKT